MSPGIRAFALWGIIGVTWEVPKLSSCRRIKPWVQRGPPHPTLGLSAVIVIWSSRWDVALARYVLYWNCHKLVGPAKCFLPTNSRRKVLSRVNPGPFGKVLCECDSFIFAILSHCGTRDELVADLTPLADVGAFGCRAFSSWPLSFQKLDSGLLWISWDCPPSPSLFIVSSALRSSQKVGWFHFHSLQCREEPDKKAQHTCWRAPLNSL